jgi:hypothetical protein
MLGTRRVTEVPGALEVLWVPTLKSQKNKMIRQNDVSEVNSATTRSFVASGTGDPAPEPGREAPGAPGT